MKFKHLFLSFSFLWIFSYCSSSKEIKAGPENGEQWKALHIMHNISDPSLDSVSLAIPKLASMGINVLFYEVDYNFDFQSHPELRMSEKNITKEDAAKFAELCRKNDIRLIIQFQCFGHQSWAQTTFPLLTKYPHLDLTSGAYPNNDSIYCREWNPTNPQVYEIVFSLLDELIDAFQTDGIHVGLDEVFLINDRNAKSTKHKNPAKVFAKVVNDLHDFIVKKRQLEMFMWGDRLIDGTKYSYGEWESSLNGTAPAIDMIPKDIVICDWHYEVMDEYPSIPMFLEKGFRLLSVGWKDSEATRQIIKYSEKQKNPKILGHMFTAWNAGYKEALNSEAVNEGMKLLKKK